MSRIALVALLLSLVPQDAKPGWQARLEAASKTPAAWQARKAEIRRQILVASGLWPEFERPPIKADVFGKIDGDGYTIEKVTLETLPGFLLCGSLYRPKDKKGPFPAIAAPHGHWKEGRFTQAKDGNFPTLGISLARLGFVSFHYDMVGYADTKQLPHKFQDLPYGQGLFGLQTWNSLRAIDFIAGLPDVDPKRIGCTGASGGGTQTFILAAIDDRIACAVPVNMVAAEFQGGCSCENAPFLRLGLNNVEIAAMTAPRPLLMISCTGDWTKNNPTLEGPVVQKTFETLGVGEKYRVVQFTAPHNYNQDSREAAYAWFVRWLQNGPDQPKIDEPTAPAVKVEDLAIWTGDRKPPALDAAGVQALLREKITAQLASLQPKDAASLKKYRDLMEPAWRVMVPARTPNPAAAPLLSTDAVLVVAAKAEDAQPLADAAAAKGAKATVLVLGAHEAEPTAGGDANQRRGYPTTFYRTELARQVEDILEAVGKISSQGRPRSMRLVGLGDAALPVLLSRIVAAPTLQISQSIVDASALDAATEKQTGLQRLGGWQGAAALAPAGYLVLHGKKFEAEPIRAAFKAAGREGAVTISDEAWTRERLLEELSR